MKPLTPREESTCVYPIKIEEVIYLPCNATDMERIAK
jgi:hypothetical protein